MRATCQTKDHPSTPRGGERQKHSHGPLGYIFPCLGTPKWEGAQDLPSLQGHAFDLLPERAHTATAAKLQSNKNQPRPTKTVKASRDAALAEAQREPKRRKQQTLSEPPKLGTEEQN